MELSNTEEIARYVADFRGFLKDGTSPERKTLIRNFVEGIEVMGDEATLTYTVPSRATELRRNWPRFLISSSPAHQRLR